MRRGKSSAIVTKVRNYAHVLKNAGVGYGDYVEQITYLLFGSDLRSPGFAQPCGLPMSASLSFSSSLNPHE
jgi:type I restriction enzyme M protein